MNLGAGLDGIGVAKVRKMREAGRRVLLWAAAVAAVAAVVILVSGEKDEPDEPSAPVAVEEEAAAPTAPGEPGGGPAGGGGGGRPAGKQEGGSSPPAGDERSGREIIRERIARDAGRTYRAYVAAINARDGEALCELLAPGFLGELAPAVRREDCAATMRASIGYEDPRRFPVWEETVLTGLEQVAAQPATGQARVTAAVITRFSDRTEPSVESDIAYLGPIAGEMRLLKASGVLWRAVGKPDYPPSVISPP